MPPLLASTTTFRPVVDGHPTPPLAAVPTTPDCIMRAAGCTTPARQALAPIIFFVTYYALGPGLRPGGSGVSATKMARPGGDPHNALEHFEGGPLTTSASFSPITLPGSQDILDFRPDHVESSTAPPRLGGAVGDPASVSDHVVQRTPVDAGQTDTGMSVTRTRYSIRVQMTSAERQDSFVLPTDIVASHVQDDIASTRIRDLQPEFEPFAGGPVFNPSWASYTTRPPTTEHSDGTAYLTHSTATPELQHTLGSDTFPPSPVSISILPSSRDQTEPGGLTQSETDESQQTGAPSIPFFSQEVIMTSVGPVQSVVTDLPDVNDMTSSLSASFEPVETGIIGSTPVAEHLGGDKSRIGQEAPYPSSLHTLESSQHVLEDLTSTQTIVYDSNVHDVPESSALFTHQRGTTEQPLQRNKSDVMSEHPNPPGSSSQLGLTEERLSTYDSDVYTIKPSSQPLNDGFFQSSTAVPETTAVHLPHAGILPTQVVSSVVDAVLEPKLSHHINPSAMPPNFPGSIMPSMSQPDEGVLPTMWPGWMSGTPETTTVATPILPTSDQSILTVPSTSLSVSPALDLHPSVLTPVSSTRHHSNIVSSVSITPSPTLGHYESAGTEKMIDSMATPRLTTPPVLETPEKAATPTPSRDKEGKGRTGNTKPGKGGGLSTAAKYTPSPLPPWSKSYTKWSKVYPVWTVESVPARTDTTAITMPTTIRPLLKPPELHIRIALRMAWTDFCLQKRSFRKLLTTILDKKVNQSRARKYYVVLTLGHECEDNNSVNMGRRSTEISIIVYIANQDGSYNKTMTDKFADAIDNLKEYSGPFKGKITDVSVIGKAFVAPRGKKTSGLGAGVLAGIVIAAIVVACIVVFFVLQMAMLARNRNAKKMRAVRDDPARSSVDVHSLEESIQMANIAKIGEKFGYVNRGLETEDKKDYTSNPVTLAGLCRLLSDSNTEELEEEFLMLPNYMPKLNEVPVGSEDKNRYANVIPIPETRVPLNGRASNHHSNYINANYVRGYRGRSRVYIATQAPMANTRADFWHMVWTQQSQVIIMITALQEHGQVKCAEYWPNTEGPDTVRIYGDYNVQLKARDVHPDWTVSALALKNMETNLTREVHHFHLTGWPPHGVPDHPAVVLRHLHAVRPFMMDSHGPTVVHCSPGTGRTGTVLAIHIGMMSYDLTRTVDVLQCARQLREDRGGAIQTREQYIFIYRALLEHAMRLASPSMASWATLSSDSVRDAT